LASPRLFREISYRVALLSLNQSVILLFFFT
jgi:hypothetical protein